MRTLFIGLTLFISYSNAAFIVPQEIPSILSLVYSNIPPIKKGTDSRVGFGFRLGEHADFQVQFEIGPQKFTRPIGNGPGEETDTSKRMVDQTDFDKKIKPPPNDTGSQWLNNWANDMKVKTTPKTRKPATSSSSDSSSESESLKSLFNTKNQYPIPAAPVIPQSSLRQLQQLYTKPNETQIDIVEQSIGTLPSKTMEAHVSAARERGEKLKKEQIKADLMDVSLDE